MDSATRYKYEKRIRELERELRQTRDDLIAWRTLGRALFDWLAEFADKRAEHPNAAWGLAQFRQKGLL